jgi:hypothetical protein
MNHPKYPVFTDDKYEYFFVSEGPRGKISKGVVYSPLGGNLFNLGFGDWNEKLKDLDDSTRSNNGDRDKVLMTVASTALDFTDEFPGAEIFIEGSTSARTRLYQMGIGDNILAINKNFEVKGSINGSWEPFQKGRNYDAFLIRRK